MNDINIEELIKLFDDYLISKGKPYISLRTANEILKRQENEKFANIDLKKLLTENRIPHAYQTEKKPKQWQIPYSNPDEFKEKRKDYLKDNKSQIIPKIEKPKLNILAYVILGITILFAINILKPKKESYKSQPSDFISEANQSESKQSESNQNHQSQHFPSTSDHQPEHTNHNIQEKEEINLNDFTGQKFTFKSTSNDNELNGNLIETNNEISYHTFDFINMTVTAKFPYNEKWVTMTYPIRGYYKQKGLIATTHVLEVNTLGVKEIWFSADVPNLGYDFDDGHRIACYNLSQVN